MRETRKKEGYKTSEQGAALILVMLIGVVAALIGIWGMTSSRESHLRVGTYRSALGVQYEAEQAMDLAVLRIQTIANSADGSDDPINPSNGKMLSFLVDPTLQNGYYGLCEPNECAGEVDIPCPNDFEPTDDRLDFVDQDSSGNRTNVICNFMGDSLKNTRVSLVRKNDTTENGTAAIFLLNVVSVNKAGRRKVLQGVVVAPYDPGTNTMTASPYLATSSKPTD